MRLGHLYMLTPLGRVHNLSRRRRICLTNNAAERALKLGCLLAPIAALIGPPSWRR